MEELTFNVGDILSAEEAEQLFENTEPAEQKEETAPEADKPETTTQPTDETVSVKTETSHEKVGAEETDEDEDNAVAQDSDGSSPSVYSSIANALKDDGIFPDLEEDDINSIESAEDFAEFFEKAVDSRLDEKQRRISQALGYGVAPDTVKTLENSLQYLGSINDEVIASEGEDGENLRKQLIYSDLISRGYSQERALRELEKSFTAGTDVEDAKDAKEALTQFYSDRYADVQEEARAAQERRIASIRKSNQEIQDAILKQDITFGDSTLDKKTCQRIYDSVAKPVYKDPETGNLLTAVQKFAKDNPTEFAKQVGMWYVLTEGGKNLKGFTKAQVRAEKNKAIKELGRKINSSSLNRDGTLKYVSGASGETDPLLSDGWKVGW